MKLTFEEHVLDVDSTEICTDGRVKVASQQLHSERLDHELQRRYIRVTVTLGYCH